MEMKLRVEYAKDLMDTIQKWCENNDFDIVYFMSGNVYDANDSEKKEFFGLEFKLGKPIGPA